MKLVFKIQFGEITPQFMSLSSNWSRKMLSPSENVGSNPASDVALKDCGVIVQTADPCYWCSLSAFLGLP